MNIKELKESMRGVKHANLNKMAQEYFTPDFLDGYSHSLLQLARLSRDAPVKYRISELDKCIIHYTARNITDDLWKFSVPTIGSYLDATGRFKLDKALASNKYGAITENVLENLEVGRKIIFGITSVLYDDWVDSLGKRNSHDPTDLIPKLIMIYKFHSIVINGGDWKSSTILGETFTNGGKEMFEWMAGQPDMTRREIEEIAENSVKVGIHQASQLGMKSSAIENVVNDAAKKGHIAYLFNPQARKIVFNPIFQEDVKKMEEGYNEAYYDQTQLLLGCPVMFVPSQHEKGSSMLHELIRFRYGVFTEIYLATHGRR